jgi:hypothetical protein
MSAGIIMVHRNKDGWNCGGLLLVVKSLVRSGFLTKKGRTKTGTGSSIMIFVKKLDWTVNNWFTWVLYSL